MKPRMYVLPLVALTIMIATESVTAQGQVGIKVGVVNLGEIFDKYYKKKELDADLRAESEKRREVIQAKSKEIAKLEEELALFDLGTDAGKRTEEKLFQKKVERDTYRKMAQEVWVKKQRDFTIRLYEEIQAHIADYAKREKIDLVLKVEDSEIRVGTLDMVHLEIKLRTILFHKPDLNITTDVIAYLNADKPAE